MKYYKRFQDRDPAPSNRARQQNKPSLSRRNYIQLRSSTKLLTLWFIMLSLVAMAQAKSPTTFRHYAHKPSVKKFNTPSTATIRKKQGSFVATKTLHVRGGSSSDLPPPGGNAPPQHYHPPPQQDYQQQQQNLSSQQQQQRQPTGYNDNPPPEQQQPQTAPVHSQEQQQQQQQQQQQPQAIDNNNDTFGEDDLPSVRPDETFQDRIDQWRHYQMEHAAEQQNPFKHYDEKGKLKLLTQFTKGNRILTFFLFMWRMVHLYEVWDSSTSGIIRMMGVVPLTFLFVANLVGAIVSTTAPAAGHKGKKRLKAILNLDKLLELWLVVWYLTKLILAPLSNELVPREQYISYIIHSVLFLFQGQTATKLVWDDQLSVSTHTAPPPNSNPSYVDDEDEQQPPPQWTSQPQQQDPSLYQKNPNYRGS